MKKSILILLTLIVLVLFTPSNTLAQNSFTCVWDNSVGECTVGTEQCDESIGESATPTLCEPIQNAAACNASGYSCATRPVPPPDTTNKYSCQWFAQINGCVPSVVDNCSPGFEPGNSCGFVSPDECNSGKLFTCIAVNSTEAEDTAGRVQLSCEENEIETAIGCVPLGDVTQLTQFFLRWAVGIAGGVALLLIGFAAYRISTSQGDPRRLQGGQELLLSAIGGLIMVVLSIYLLRFIGVDLLGLF